VSGIAATPVYFDMYSLQRPFDTAAHVHDATRRAAMEANFAADTAALEALLGRVMWVASPIHRHEIADCTDTVRIAYVDALLEAAPIQLQEGHITLQDMLRLADIIRSGIKPKDSMHLLYAELSGAVLVTVDTTFRNRASQIAHVMVYSLQEAEGVLP